jgi:phosphate transport system substrate-binding protein
MERKRIQMVKTSLRRPRVVGALLAAVGVGAMLALPVSAQRGGTLAIKGSDTMVNLSQAWAEAFMQKNPSASISVTGGGSGTGIAAFLNGTCDIANASRPMSAREIDQSKQRNVLPKATTCALDGLAIAVNSSNTLASIVMDQLAGIFSGKIADWSRIPNAGSGRIVALSRESNSGTHVYFKEHVLNNGQYGSSVLFMPSTKAIQQELSNNRAAIGYGGEAYFKNKQNVKILPVATKKGAPAVYPSNENVANKSYPISRGLYMYTPGSPKGLAGEFIKFCLSPEGQRIVQQIGYVPLPNRRASQ